MRNDFTDCHFNFTETAHYLGRSTRWLRYQLDGPHPPPGFKIDTRWIFRKSELDRWFEQFRAVSDIDKIVEDLFPLGK